MREVEHYLPNDLIEMLGRQHYSLFGHSAVKLCHWAKASLRSGKVCYKQRFYGIKSHRCLQMTPTVAFCQLQCQFCWRPLTNAGSSLKEFDEPKEIVGESIKRQRVLLSGYGALRNEIGDKKLEEANNPNQVAISLSGEPTLYPLLPELIKEYHKNKFSSFVVSNGMLPGMIEKIKPTQLYLSLDAADEKTHKRINAPTIKNSWNLLNESIELFPSIKTRKCIRVTAIKGMNMNNEKEFASLIEKAAPDFIEVKSYMFVGYSRKRMKEENMPLHSEVRDFAERINKHLGYKLVDEQPESRVVLLWNGKTKRMID